MHFPLSATEIMTWLGATAFTLLVTSEIISPWYGQIGLFIDKRKFKGVAIFFFAVFLVSVFIQVYEIFTY